ncbi:MAG: NADH-quinone oxidoreductase subunit A [Desulfobulbaceae bacterium]|nr:NADH-quinone oxidoreductase subunit A [Desulfobulbaceae bacterium]HIJ90874.1 NADH-quinone oxidoreductase subunit A [Deltaproteobacteria bacterium]
MASYTIIGFAIFLGALFVGGGILASMLLAFRTPHCSNKVQAYECAEDPVGDARIRFKVSYYLFALLFLIFDIESLFLFPCVKIFRTVATQATALSPTFLLGELSVFVFILFSGLLYVWKKGVLRWE